MKQKITLTITPKQKEFLNQLARNKDISISELLRNILDEWLDRQANLVPPSDGGTKEKGGN